MYTKLYKRSAEKWQKVAILQKTQKKAKKRIFLVDPLWYTLTEKMRFWVCISLYFGMLW